MADLIRTQCGRISDPEKLVFKPDDLTSCFNGCYKKRFRPLIPTSAYFVRNLRGYHSDMSKSNLWTLKN